MAEEIKTMNWLFGNKSHLNTLGFIVLLVGPRMSGDIMFLMRTNLPPDRRGLSPSEMRGDWYLAEDFPG